MVQNYSGTRLAQDITAPNSAIPAYLPEALKVTDGKLNLKSNKGIGYLTSNNQINALGVMVDSRDKMIIKTEIINPFYGSKGQQAGIWFGISDKTYIKLVVTNNKIELRRELNDVSDKTIGSANVDQRTTATINRLHTYSVGLKLIIDPAKNAGSGFYSTDGGQTYINVGINYPLSSVSLSGMGITASKAYTGLLASHRDADTPVTYSFNNFSVSKILQFDSSAYNFNINDNSLTGSLAGRVRASAIDGGAITYRIQSGNTNGAFSIDENSGQILVNKRLNHHTQSEYMLNVVAATELAVDEASVLMRITVATDPIQDFTTINWTKAAFQPFKVSEAQGETVNGKWYNFGGFDSQKSSFTPTKRSYGYDPVADTWTRIADLPHTPNGTNLGGISHAGTATDGTDIYFSGGYTSNATGTGQIFGTQQVWKYHVASNTYIKLPDLPIKLAAGQLEFVNGRLHHIGGTNLQRTQDMASHYVLDLDDITAGWKAMAPLPNPRQHAGSTVFKGKIYYIGGQYGHDEHLVTQKDVHVYDPKTNLWTKLADLPAPGNYGLGHISSSVVVMGNQIIVLGGEAVHLKLRVALVSAYNPATNIWTSLTPMPVTRYSGVAAVLNGSLYYTGGSNGSTTFKGIAVNNNAVSRKSADLKDDYINLKTKAGIKKSQFLQIHHIAIRFI